MEGPFAVHSECKKYGFLQYLSPFLPILYFKAISNWTKFTNLFILASTSSWFISVSFCVPNFSTQKDSYDWRKYIEYKFFNLKDDILSKILISEWINAHSLEKIINKKSTTWRNLNEASKNQLDTEAVNIIINFPSLMKRPIWELNTKPHKELDPGFQDRHQNFIKKLV